MNEVLSVVLASMHADVARVERVGMNLANARTPGYRREVVSAMPFDARMEAAGLRMAAPAGAAYAVHTDTRAGTLQSTGQSLDLAIVGDGWFEVATDQGIAYTRQGNFRLDARGRMVTQAGLPLVGSGGDIQLLHGNPVIDSSGRVFEGTAGGTVALKADRAPVAQLRVVRFEAGAAMERLGDGLVRVQAEGSLVPEGSVQVQQGFLENSNVSHMQEMVRLMEAVRHMESMQKVAIGYDEMLGASIRRLGEP